MKTTFICRPHETRVLFEYEMSSEFVWCDALAGRAALSHSEDDIDDAPLGARAYIEDEL